MAPNTKLSETDVCLRIITILTYLPALGFIIGYMIAGERGFSSAFLIAPTLSLLLAAIVLIKKMPDPILLVFLDIAVTAVLIATIVLLYLRVAVFVNTWWSPERITAIGMVGAHAAYTLCINMVIHVYFSIRGLLALPGLLLKSGQSSSCPNCHHNMQERGTAEEDEPLYKDNRPSTEEQTERLV